MSGAAVLFYGRRSRSSSSRTFDDFGFSSSSSDPNTNNNNTIINHRRHHHHHHNRHHRRHRHISFDDPPRSPPLPLSGSETHQGGNSESLSQDINNRETVHGVSGRYVRNNSLPGSVLLAKERLVQRLRGVSVSGNRENRERLPSLPSNQLWVVDADWETNVSREEPASYAHLTELQLGESHHSTSGEPHMKPMGLTCDALAQLHHEVFVENKTPITSPISNESSDCGICLESFVEGNKLINLPCGHKFHSSCLYPWLQTCGECPYCRSCIKLT